MYSYKYLSLNITQQYHNKYKYIYVCVDVSIRICVVAENLHEIIEVKCSFYRNWHAFQM